MSRKLLVLAVGLLLATTSSALVLRDAHARTAASPQAWAKSDIAVLLPLAHCSLEGFWQGMSSCIENVAAGAEKAGKTVSVHVAAGQECSAHLDGEGSTPLPDGVQVSVSTMQANSSGELLSGQLEEARQAGVEHELVLVVGADAGFHHSEVTHRAVQSLCGSVPQVVSVLYQFQRLEILGMQLLAPLGTMMTQRTQTADILPALRRSRFGQDETCEAIVSQQRLGRLGPDAPSQEASVAVAGGMFWVRHKALPQRVSELSSSLRATETGDAQDMQRTLLEVWIPTLVRSAGGLLAEMAPAPKPLAIYFPQYHPIPENDKFWGKDFTEWTLLQPCNGTYIRKPLDVESGGLGYYDLRDTEVRRKQAELARDHGIHGFVYYHYWFSSVEGHKVMHKVPELRLADGQPDLPFMLSWANEPWSRHWDGRIHDDNSTMLAQDYGSGAEWEEHFKYLLQFFRHPKYIRVEGKPAFAIYRPEHIGSKLEIMLTFWDRLARKEGLPGLHIIATVGGFYGHPGLDTWHQSATISAAFHYVASCRYCWKGQAPPGKETTSTSADVPGVVQRVQYWGASAGFDNSPRRGEHVENFAPFRLSPSDFRLAVSYSLQGMAQNPQRDISDNLYFLASWNEWNEQSVLEPDDKYKLGFLEALVEQLRKMPVRFLPSQ